MRDKDILLCLGASPASSDVYFLSLSFFQLTSLPALRTPRYGAGVVKDHCYAFGGWNGKERLRICEKMQLSDPSWTVINRKMTEQRHGFTRCHALIYLVAAIANSGIETFNAETETFAVLPVTLPSQLRDSWSVAFIENGELCLLTANKQKACWKIEIDREFRLSDTAKESWSCQPPLIVGTLAYMRRNYAAVQSRDLHLLRLDNSSISVNPSQFVYKYRDKEINLCLLLMAGGTVYQLEIRGLL